MTLSTLILRSYRPDDLDSLFHLDQVCFDKSFRFSRSAMRRFAEAKNARVIIGELDRRLAGFCIVHIETVHDEAIAYLVTLDVDPALRRIGLARTLMSRVKDIAIADRCNALVLHVFTGNPAAVRFYEREGFERITDQLNFYGRGLDAVVYRRLLTA